LFHKNSSKPKHFSFSKPIFSKAKNSSKPKHLLLLKTHLLKSREASALHHNGRPTHDDKNIIGGRKELLLEEIKRDETGGTGPIRIFSPVREDVGNLEPVRMLLGPTVESFAAEQIIDIVASKNKTDLSLVVLRGVVLAAFLFKAETRVFGFAPRSVFLPCCGESHQRPGSRE